ncbi:MAG: ribosome maturation factor RimP [Candidatus Vecturithrix sp.]|jgi:ribosome maturation factor RimP|nr:ribosome maturation factor RimP [Candidatus Vecturithrix sp.]
MTGHTIVEKVKTLINPIIEEQELELVDVEFKREGHLQYLRIFIDKPGGGVSIDDCQHVSRECEVLLDIEDIIRTQYVLEVSSPGLDRPLKTIQDYQRFQGRLAKIKVFQSIQGQKKFLGYIHGVTQATPDSAFLITLLIDGKEEIQIPCELIASARLEVEF